jgi:chaperonin GroES
MNAIVVPKGLVGEPDPEPTPTPDDVVAAALKSAAPETAGGEALTPAPRPAPTLPEGPLPIRMLSDRLLVMLDAESAERRSKAGILIPVTASMGKRLSWGITVAQGAHVRQVKLRDRVLFDPEDRAEVEIQGQVYILLRERDVHGVAQDPDATEDGGLYL